MMLPSVHVGLQTLRANPIRTLLSTLGIVMGAASLVGILAVGDGAQLLARRQIERFGLQSVMVMPKTFDLVDGLAVARASYPAFTIAHAQSLSARLGSACEVALSVAGTGTFVAHAGGPSRAATVTAAYGSLNALLGGLTVTVGRFLTDDEMSSDQSVVVISNNLARELAEDRSLANVVNTSLQIEGKPWRIVGALEEIPNERTFGLIVPLRMAPVAMRSAALLATGPMRVPVDARPERPPSLSIRAPRIEDVLDVQHQVEAWADATDARWRKDQQISISGTGVERLRQLNQGMLIAKLLMGAFAGISLVVGGIGIMNVLLAAVAERTREIGVRKAAGATRRDIAAQFLSESVTISLAGALLGAALGFSAATAITAFIRWRTSTPMYAVFTWPTFVASMSTAIVIGLIFGVYPALKAARLSPVDAMRYD
ncbi:MAG TPA: ABC transporter permease [Vicinamibacterales bacterium]|nr:ABC transporter permease [Vicinamibacterales bacterium]